eukprot:10010969-Prorocentrum_lima.AAC.1
MVSLPWTRPFVASLANRGGRHVVVACMLAIVGRPIDAMNRARLLQDGFAAHTHTHSGDQTPAGSVVGHTGN